MATATVLDVGQDYKYGFHDPEAYVFKSRKGLDQKIVEEISWMKEEPDWMRQFRLRSLSIFEKKPMPWWADTELLSTIHFDDIYYYLKPMEEEGRTWEDVPEAIKNTFDKLGIPEAERKFLAGVSAQYDSEIVYHSIKKELESKGVIFLGMDQGLKEHPEIVKKYFGTIIPPGDNKFSALNSATWSGGSFIYVPPGVHVDIPLQAYFRINAEKMGQFERTLIIADEGSFVHYIEGCAPAGEQVSLGDRWVNIESLKPGDYVVTETGQKTRVRATMMRPYCGDIVEVKPISPHNAFRLTPEHPVLSVRRSDVVVKRKPRNGWLPEVDTGKLAAAKPTYVPVGALRVGDFVVFPKVQAHGFNPDFHSDQLRLLGYYLAEGSAFVHKKLNQSVVTFSFGETEDECIEEVKSLIQRITGKRAISVRVPQKHETRVLIYSRELMDFCLKHAGKGAETKQLSEEVMALPSEQFAPMLDAYLAGDGNICMKGNSEMRRISTASQTLARQVQELLARMEIYAGIEIRKGGEDTILGRLIHRKDQFNIIWTHSKKMGEVRDVGDYFLVPVKEINHLPYDGFVFNLDVEGPNSYLVRGFAVHNCTAPVYSNDSLHSAVVELIALPHAKIRYTTIQNWSKNVYNLVTKRAVAHEGATVEWLDGNTGCVCSGELVYMEHGPRPIETVEPGMKVWSFDEIKKQWVLRPVVAKKESGMQQVYEVVFSNGRTVRLTANHPLLSICYDGSRPRKLGRYSLSWTPLEQLSVDSYVVFPIVLTMEGATYRFAQPVLPDKFVGRNQYGAVYEVPSHSRLPVSLPAYADEDVCWMLGLWLAEGDYTIQNGTNGLPRLGRVGWSVPREDRARKRLVGLLNQYVGKSHILEERKDGIYLRVNSLEFTLWLQANGLVSGAKQKRVPEWVFTLPTNLQLSFLAGYLDGDGCAFRSGLVVKSASQELLSDIQMLATLCGLHTGAVHTVEMTKDINGTGKPKIYVTYRLALSHVQALIPFLSTDLRSRLKVARLEYRYHRVRGVEVKNLLSETVGVTHIVEIRPSVIGPTYDLEIADTTSFVVNGILVHNSKLTMKYPGVYLVGPKARGEVLSIAFAGTGQHQDAGAKMVHAAPDTTSTITSKSISKDTGRSTYRGLVKVYKGATGVKSNVRCDALLLSEESRSDTYPTMEIEENDVSIGHEATVSKVGEEQLFYLMSRGIGESEALMMIVNGFIEPFTKELPMEYAVELNRLIQLEMEGSVG